MTYIQQWEQMREKVRNLEQEQRKIGAVEHQFIRMAYSVEKQAAG